MDQGKIFRTKTGFCHVLSDKILLTRNGVPGSISNVVVGNKSIVRILVLYGILALLLFYLGYTKFKNDETITGSLFVAIGAYLLFGIFTSLNNSSVPVIERDRIVNIKFIRGISGLTRSRFIVSFRDENNRIKKRMILMPGSLNGEKEENEKALKIMQEEGLM